MDLKLKRVARRVTVKELAEVMGVTSSRVSQIEALANVTPASTARYLAALSGFPIGNQQAA